MLGRIEHKLDASRLRYAMFGRRRKRSIVVVDDLEGGSSADLTHHRT